MTSKLARAAIGLLLLTAAAGMTLRANRSHPPAKLPLNDLRMAPEPHWKFACPEGWNCPNLEHPRTWRPPGPPPDPYDHEVRYDEEKRA